MMLGRRVLLLVGAAWALSIGIAAGADESRPEELLKEKGLRRLSSHFSLPDEASLGKRIRDAAQLKKKLLEAQRKVQACQQKVEEKSQLMIACLQRRSELRAQLAGASSVTTHNRIVNAMNELADRIVLMQESKQEETALSDAQAIANKQTEQYVEHLLQARKLYETVTKQYQELGDDKSVAQAIEQYNATGTRTYKLGPTPSFLSYGRRLKTLEEAVLSESVSLRKGQGNLWHVSAMFNGKHSQEIAIDTGASLVTLPWAMAQAMGLEPGPSDPTVQLQLADGSVVEGKRVVAKSVRVGKFTVEDVQCAVMPQPMTEATPLLGLSFFKHFTFKIDTANSKLIMSRVESPDPGGQARPKRDR